MPVIELNQVSKYYGSLLVLNQLNLQIDEGEVLGLFGHNGAGKTTTIKMILGLMAPSQGTVSVLGVNPKLSESSQMRFQLGFLPENVAFYAQLTGWEVLKFFAGLKKVSKQRCQTLLEQVGLTHAMHRTIKHYSKGMRQRLGLAQALLTEPNILLLDEPTVGLDPIATQDFYTMVDAIKQKGCAIILCSHVLPGVEKHIDRAAILSNGCLQACGTLKQLRSQAELNMTITLQGAINLASIQDDSITITSFNSHTHVLTASPTEKLSLIKKLVALDGLEDIDIQAPSLEQLYRHYIEQPIGGRDECNLANG